MKSATTTTGTPSYTYAPDGLRTSKTIGGVTTDFAWDDTTPVPALLQDGDNYYIYGPDGLPIERIGTDPTRWLMCDATGSVTLTTDQSAGISSVQGYDPWGNPTVTTGTPVSLGWQHQYQDTETGYYNLWHRYYDPTTAQFTTPDPLFALTGSRYGYAGNDPVNGSDPSGLKWCFHNPFGHDSCQSEWKLHPGIHGPLVAAVAVPLAVAACAAACPAIADGFAGWAASTSAGSPAMLAGYLAIGISAIAPVVVGGFAAAIGIYEDLTKGCSSKRLQKLNSDASHATDPNEQGPDPGSTPMPERPWSWAPVP